MTMTFPITPFANRLRHNRSGVAMLEFALTLPILLLLSLTGAELTNYITVKMRVSQIALQLADNAARIGAGSQLAAKTITETDINDLLTGAGLQGGELDLYTRGRVIVSSVEPTANPNTANTYKIAWRRCRGAKTTYTSTYTNVATGLVGVGPTGQKITAPVDGATMFVEVYYEYQPLVKSSLAPASSFIEIASMMVRDRRDLTRVYNTEGATVSSC